MTDADWMVDNLKDDLALQMALFTRGAIDEIDVQRLERLAAILGHSFSPSDGQVSRQEVSELLDKYAFAATKYILKKAKQFTHERDKQLMVILLDPYRVTRVLLEGGERYDQEIVDFLKENKFRVFDMNLVHVEDYKSFNLSVADYFKRYYIGHYNPTGNHLFAYSLKDHVVDWLDPKPLPYRDVTHQSIDFKGYLPGN